MGVPGPTLSIRVPPLGASDAATPGSPIPMRLLEKPKPTQMRKDAARSQMIRLYFPDAKSGRIYYEEREVTFYTNDFTGKVIETACRNAIKERTGKTLSDGTLVKSLTLGDDGAVRVDFSASLTAEMDAVPEYETLILQCIADTLGYYFNSDRVILTVEGKPLVEF
jgi:spore germination protein GerM